MCVMYKVMDQLCFESLPLSIYLHDFRKVTLSCLTDLSFLFLASISFYFGYFITRSGFKSSLWKLNKCVIKQKENQFISLLFAVGFILYRIGNIYCRNESIIFLEPQLLTYLLIYLINFYSPCPGGRTKSQNHIDRSCVKSFKN